MTTALLEIKNVVRDYRLPKTSVFTPAKVLRVLHGVSLTLPAGQSLGVVGESGSGKSTLARCVMGLEPPQSGKVLLEDQDIYSLDRVRLKSLRSKFQMIFQDPYSSLDPRHTIRKIIMEPLLSLEKHSAVDERNRRIDDVLKAVGLPLSAADKYPHEFSGGQRQRIAIARALITRPALIVADEPVSALDVSIQAQVLNLMMDLQELYGLSYLFISHDLGVVRAITDRVVVMHLGRIVEEGPTQTVFDTPQHPYTQALIKAVPKPFTGRRSRAKPTAPPVLQGTQKAGLEMGCAYAPFCPHVTQLCRMQTPDFRSTGENRLARCHYVGVS